MSEEMKLLSLLMLAFFVPQLAATEMKDIHVSSPRQGGTWMDFTSSEELNLKKLFELLKRSPTGEKLLLSAQRKAANSGQTLLDVIKVGEGSLTDTTLVRKFNPSSPEHVSYESRSVVFINRSLSWDNALLDLAHELTHFIFRESFNPYALDFNAQDFVRGTIEGQGGEAQAFLTECKVLKELFSHVARGRSHCKNIEIEGRLSRRKAIELFYHVGPYYDSFRHQLKQRNISSEFKEIKPEKINFISSAYGVPYPVAALMEYDLVINKVCENDKKRIAYMQQGPQRNPASDTKERDKLVSSYSARCKSH